MSALDDLLSDFTSNAGTMPAVNPPEAAKVLATQTAPEVAGEPEPAPVEDKPAPPTEKPADVVAAEQAKARKPRQSKPKADAPPDGWNNLPAEPAPAATNGDRLETAIRFIAMHTPKGATITIQGGSLKGSAHQLGELIFADQAGLSSARGRATVSRDAGPVARPASDAAACARKLSAV